ncbi:MAG: hypothetical protein LBI03_09650, partial [Clostridiales bacterium]|nr:hypothetical protein [Clostridiales bacterium]
MKNKALITKFKAMCQYIHKMPLPRKLTAAALAMVIIASAAVIPQMHKTLAIDTLSSINGGGANDLAQNQFIVTNTLTSGNSDYTTGRISQSGYPGNMPGSWRDHINSIWMDQAMTQFSWSTIPAYKNWVWNGGTATVNGDASLSATNIPTAVSGVWTVYSGEQLLYSLTYFTSGQTIQLGGDIDMNGNNIPWTPFVIGGRILTLNGSGYAIRNIGVFNENDGASFLSTFSAPGSIIENIKFQNCKLVSGSTATAGVGTAIFWAAGNATFKDINVNDSLFYGVDSSSVVSSNSNYLNCQRVYVDGCFVYGRDHVNGFVVGGGSGVATSSGDNISYCYSINSLIVSYGGHSAMFFSCASYNNTLSDCFCDNQMYGAVTT